MIKCPIFICKYNESCLYGIDCSGGAYCCKLDKCGVCLLKKHCVLKKGEKKKMRNFLFGVYMSLFFRQWKDYCYLKSLPRECRDCPDRKLNNEMCVWQNSDCYKRAVREDDERLLNRLKKMFKGKDNCKK